MIPILAATVVSLALSARATDLPEDITPVVETFVEALRTRDGARLAEVVKQSGRPEIRFGPVSDLMERSRCPVVDSYAFTIDFPDQQKASVTIAIDGSAESTGAVRARFAMPRSWSLSLLRENNHWLIERAETRDWMIGRLMSQAVDDAARERLLASAEDPRSAVRAAAEIASRPDSDRNELRRFDLMRFIERWANSEGDRSSVAFIQRRRSRLFIITHRSTDAIEEAKRALCTAEESGDADVKAEAFFGVATASWLAGRESDALSAYAQAAEMLHSLDDPRPAIRAVYMPAVILMSRDPRAALSCVTKSDELSVSYDWYRGSIDAATARADIYNLIGDIDSAAHWYQVAATQSTRVLDPNYTVAAYTGLAMCAIERGQLSEARIQLERLLSLSPGGDVAVQLGRVLTRLGKYEEAERQLLEAIARSEGDEQWNLAALARTYLAEIRLAQHHNDEALTIATTALENATKVDKTRSVTGETFAEWHARLVAARALRKLNRPDEAMAMLQAAIDLIESEYI